MLVKYAAVIQSDKLRSLHFVARIKSWRLRLEKGCAKGGRSIGASLGENRLEIAWGIHDERNDDSSGTFRTSSVVLPGNFHLAATAIQVLRNGCGWSSSRALSYKSYRMTYSSVSSVVRCKRIYRERGICQWTLAKDAQGKWISRTENRMEIHISFINNSQYSASRIP